jgi:hypothetical protein
MVIDILFQMDNIGSTAFVSSMKTRVIVGLCHADLQQKKCYRQYQCEHGQGNGKKIVPFFIVGAVAGIV